MASQGSPAVREGFINTNGHGRMHYQEAGSGEPLILIHTNGGSVYQYADAIGPLSKKFRVILWDMPGHGDSDPLSRHYSIEDYCLALVAFMDAMGIRKAHVSGCSCGGSISAGFASIHHTRALSVVIVELPFRSNEEWGARWGHTEANFGIPTQSRDEVSHRLNKVDDAVLMRWNIDRNKAGGKTMVSVMWAMRLFDVKTAIENLGCPTMVLFGAKGPAVSLKDRYTQVSASLPVKALDNCGHFPMLDEPESFANALIGFCGPAARG